MRRRRRFVANRMFPVFDTLRNVGCVAITPGSPSEAAQQRRQSANLAFGG
jgi:hypothetical protein